MFRPFYFIAPKTYLAFQSFDFERTWWRLFQKRVVHTKFDIFVFILTNNTPCRYTLWPWDMHPYNESIYCNKKTNIYIGMGKNILIHNRPPTTVNNSLLFVRFVLFVCLMMFMATFNNISAILELTTSVVICTDCIGSCKSNYHTITATTPPTLGAAACCSSRAGSMTSYTLLRPFFMDNCLFDLSCRNYHVINQNMTSLSFISRTFHKLCIQW
jgi:hypothetical protein